MNRADDLFERLSSGGVSAIDELIATRKAEELFLDFKRSGDDGRGPHLHDSDNKNFAKAISGFGNSEGGVVVWGVDCSRAKDGADVATAKVPLHDAAAFASRVESTVSRATIPAHSGVRNFPITLPHSAQGFVVSLIPKSNAAPHQTVAPPQYYMRAGSDFVPVPHSVLAGMFGRRPAPQMDIRKIIPYQAEVTTKGVEFTIGIIVANQGPGIARDIFLNLTGESVPCDGETLAFESLDTQNWIVTAFLGVHMTYLAKSDVRLPPDGYLNPCALQFCISPPFTGDLHVTGKVGCEGAMSHSFVIHNTRENIERAYKGIQGAKLIGIGLEQKLHEFPRQILGIPGSEDTV
jgi:hypothetical protein